MDNEIEFAAFIKSLRKKKGLSIAKAAGKMKISQNSIKNWEGGNHKPSSYNIDNICQFYKIEKEELLEILNLEKTENKNFETNKIKEIYKNFIEECCVLEDNTTIFSEFENNLNDLHFDKEDQDLFLILCIASECEGDAMPIILRRIKDYKLILNTFDKLRNLGLYKKKGGVNCITNKGKLILDIIKKTGSNSFDFYKLNLDEGVDFYKKYFFNQNCDSNLYKTLIDVEELISIIKQVDKYEYLNTDIPSSEVNKNKIKKYLHLNYYKIIEEKVDGLNINRVVLSEKGKNVVELISKN